MNYLLLGLVLVALLAFGCAQAGEQTKVSGGPQAPQPAGNAKQQAPTQQPQAPAVNDATADSQHIVLGTNMTTRARSGYVNKNEIGGDGLSVMSIWKLNATVMQDGSFTTEVSAVGAQLVALADKDKKLRAMAISLPEDTGPLVFDAASTTKASMWFGGSENQSVATQAMAFMETMDCYPSFYGYMKANLKERSLSEIANITNKEYFDIQMNCSSQIAGMLRKSMPN